MGNSTSKYNCGNILPSSCVPFSGANLTFLSASDLEAFPCDANMNDVVFYIDKYLKKVLDSNDFTGLNKDCFNFDPATVTAHELHQEEITAICLLKGQVTSLQTQITNLNIGTEVITLDLLCMTPDAAPCAVGTHQYQLQSILATFVAKLCDLETRLSNLE